MEEFRKILYLFLNSSTIKGTMRDEKRDNRNSVLFELPWWCAPCEQERL